MEKDFVSVVKEYRRLCDTVSRNTGDCVDCPFYEKVACNPMDFENEFHDADFVEWKRILEKWVKENPRPKYPTYGEVITSFFGIDALSKLNEEIPDEVARHYGVAPAKINNDEMYSEWR